MQQKSIKILSEDVINKIAAGEVIERPASVLKELVENSLDAGATEIIIEIREGGKRLISVLDNGCGISADEVELAFQRHATSKISSFEDLNILSTMGFRGEALPSIASVSKTSILTRTGAAQSGKKVELHGGKILLSREEGGAVGTTMRVEDLFYNTPARQKFLKTSATEYTHALGIITELALSNYKIAFTLLHDGKEIFRLPSVSALDERIYDLFGKEVQEHLLPVELKHTFITIKGSVSSPVLFRPTRNQQFFFVNNRSVRHKLFIHAVNAAYETLLPSGKYPLTFLFLDINPEYVDVNVHPTKKEVRFSNEGAVHELLLRALKESLHHKIGGEETIEDKEFFYPRHTTPPEQSAEKPVGAYTAPSHEQSTRTVVKEQQEPSPFQQTYTEHQPFIPALFFEKFTLIGQADNAFIIAANSQGLFIVDQHAASERVCYERLKREFAQKAIASQKLLLPITIELEPASKTIVLENKTLLEQLGWEVEDFGKKAILIRALPSLLETSNDRQYILDILKVVEGLGEINESANSSDMKNNILDKILKMSACHAAIRVGDELTQEAMRRLLESLAAAEIPVTCPHGRPTIIQLTKEELYKRFGRT